MRAWVDINIVFGGGWAPSEMDNMPLDELARWWQLAHEQNKSQNAAGK